LARFIVKYNNMKKFETAQRFGSSKPVSNAELLEARASLKLLKARMAKHPPTYFTDADSAPAVQQPQESNFRKAFKPNLPASKAKSIENSTNPTPKNRREDRLASNSRAPDETPIARNPSVPIIDPIRAKQSYAFEEAPGLEDGEDEELMTCPDCNRNFKASSFEKHVKVCKKVFMNKRKAFNSAAQRDLGEVPKPKATKPEPRRAANNTAKQLPAASLPKWKTQSEEFRANLRASRFAQSGDIEAYEKAAKQASALSQQSLTPCPHCGRSFNETAAEKHIPICERNAKIASIKKGPVSTRGGRGRR
jgi:uncharacterized C2H2 Zn-finger protein